MTYRDRYTEAGRPTPGRDSSARCLRCYIHHRVPLGPTQRRALRLYAEHGDQKIAAHAAGVSVNTLRHELFEAYCALEVGGAIEAFKKVGWLTVPKE